MSEVPVWGGSSDIRAAKLEPDEWIKQRTQSWVRRRGDSVVSSMSWEREGLCSKHFVFVQNSQRSNKNQSK